MIRHRWSILASPIFRSGNFRNQLGNQRNPAFTTTTITNSEAEKKKRLPKITIAVEGNIASGKTTFLEHFAKTPGIEIAKEPVDKWRSVKGHNTLGLLYENPERWSLAFQTYVQLTMVEVHTKKQVEPVKLMERSIYSAKYCFVENLYKSDKMADVEYTVLTEWFNWLIKNLKLNLDLIVYLRTEPEVCHQRISQRCRSEERGIPLDYLQALHNMHEAWLYYRSSFPSPTKVLVIDSNQSMEKMEAIFEKNRENILFGQSL